MYVSYELDGNEIFDYSFSKEAFAYNNPNAPEPLKSVDVVIEHDLGAITLDWRDYIPWGTESVFISVIKDNTDVWSKEIPTSDGYSAEIPYDGDGTYTIEISYKNRSGMVSGKLIKPVQTKETVMQLPESGIARTDSWPVTYLQAEHVEVNIEVNDKRYSYLWNGSGSENIPLLQERNNIVVTYADADGNTHCYRRTANVFLITPEIELLRQIDGVTTQKSSILISGTTNAETLTVNKENIPIENGAFSYEYKLSGGENYIRMEATIGDSVTQLSACVTKGSANATKWTYLVCGLLVSAVGIAVVILLTWLQHKSKHKAVVPIVVCWVLDAAVWAVWVTGKVYSKSESYLTLAYNSLNKAKELLALLDILFWTCVVLTGLTLLGTATCLIVQWIRKRKEGKAYEEAE